MSYCRPSDEGGLYVYMSGRGIVCCWTMTSRKEAAEHIRTHDDPRASDVADRIEAEIPIVGDDTRNAWVTEQP